MPLGVCHCTYMAFVYEPVSTLPIILELIFSCFLILLGIAVNYRFRKKLAEEKRNRPLGRKGNVIEPIMSWFCVIQMFGFPFRLRFVLYETAERKNFSVKRLSEADRKLSAKGSRISLFNGDLSCV